MQVTGFGVIEARAADGVELQKSNILLIGPTGCGKTTTLYSCLRRVNTMDSKLLTAEDPV